MRYKKCTYHPDIKYKSEWCPMCSLERTRERDAIVIERLQKAVEDNSSIKFQMRQRYVPDSFEVP